ncbi:FtsH protease activity modulator HflK [Pontibacillus sp. ALD_SL1]|uniref:FtsH protease activity modulator HflK n=1 Tax=Pontibacillus sp. ALD_SL1 TaxID=2777185 RepID=UPI001A969E92|nr:FtsH protease activity modulator HflK [Pontibacillus sp. ALD_SL1]QSS99205.1 FtsH protease activity modulator HflK [Pontibacillus sp. ALD_SL1]
MTLKQIYTWIAVGVAAIVLVIVGITSWYTVDESEQAVILTFGNAEESITEPGLHFKMPWPVQEVEKLSKETFSLNFGYSQDDKSNKKQVQMITGDENIVLADLVVQWKIVDPAKYLYQSQDPKLALNNATSASLRSVIGTSEIDEALTSGKAEIENEVREMLIGLVESYNIGISVSDVKLQEVDLPDAEVRTAFTKVTDARETSNTKRNEAEKYRNEKYEEALGEKDAIISRAEGDKVARIEQAKGDVAKFNALYEAYSKSPDITRERLVIETLEDVLPKANIYIMNDDGNTLKYLPIGQQQAPQPAPTQGGANDDE